MKHLLPLLLLLSCSQPDRKPTINVDTTVIITRDTPTFDISSGPTTMTLYQGEDTIQLPLHPDYKEYIFWWTIRGPREFTWHTSLLYLKSEPTRARLRKEANRITHFIGGDSSTVILRDVIGYDPDDSTKWDKATKLFEKQFLATIR